MNDLIRKMIARAWPTLPFRTANQILWLLLAGYLLLGSVRVIAASPASAIVSDSLENYKSPTDGLGWWIWSEGRPDPQFNIENVKGLTPEQVIQRFGPPIADPRRSENGGWSPAHEAEYGPLIFSYDEKRGTMGYAHALVFRSGKVAEVRDGHL